MDNLIFLDRGIWGLFISPCDLGNPISPRWQRLGLRKKKKDRASQGGRHRALCKGAGGMTRPAHGGQGHPMSPSMAQGVHGFGAHPCLWAVSPQRCWVGTGDGVSSLLVCVPQPGSCGVPRCGGGGGRVTTVPGDSSCGGKGANYPGWVMSPPNSALLGAAPHPPTA